MAADNDIDDAPDDGDDIVEQALEEFGHSQDGSFYNRESWYDDVRFAVMSEQWPEDIVVQRKNEARPCLTVNKLDPLILQVVNEARANKPGIKVSPVDSGADVNTAEVISGLIRSIERNSSADVAYDTAIEQAVSGGFGFFRIEIDYASSDSFDMEARISRIPNALMVHWDVNSTEATARDWRYGFVSEWVPNTEFKKRYPNADPVDFEGQETDYEEYWLEEDKVRLAEYWKRDEVKKKLVLIKGPQGQRAIREDKMFEFASEMMKAGGLDPTGAKESEVIQAVMQMGGFEVVRERMSTFYEVTRRVISGRQVLEKQKWPGTMIPICPVWGREVFFNGRRHLHSMIRNARDPQLMHNFWRSATTELVALAPRAPYLISDQALPKDSTERQKWLTANSRNHPYLLYSGTTAPQRQPFASQPTGALQEAITANEDIQAITGVYPSAIGARSNETSGRAILARERQADTANFHFPDNLARAIRYCGECLVEIIPSVYSTRESIRILGEDMAEKVVKLTQEQGGGAINPQTGDRELYNLSIGKYDVSVSSGPSYATQREETREFLLETMRTVPGAGAVIGDLVAEYMDFPGADKLAKRLKAVLPPNVQQAEGLSQPQQPDPLDAAEKQAEIQLKNAQTENTRADAIAKIAKVGLDQQQQALDQAEMAVNGLLIPGQPSASPGGMPPQGGV